MAELKPVQLSLIILSENQVTVTFEDALMTVLYSKFNSGVIPVKNVKSISSKNCCTSEKCSLENFEMEKDSYCSVFTLMIILYEFDQLDHEQYLYNGLDLARV